MFPDRVSLSRILIVALLFAYACSRDPRKLTENGKKYLAEQKYNEAVIEFRNAIKLSPQLFEAHAGLALAFLGLGQLNDADPEFAKAIPLQPDNMELQLKYGNVLLLEGKFDEARAAAQLVLAKTTDPRAQILVANTYAGIVNLNSSLEEVKWIFDREPRLLPPFLN